MTTEMEVDGGDERGFCVGMWKKDLLGGLASTLWFFAITLNS